MRPAGPRKDNADPAARIVLVIHDAVPREFERFACPRVHLSAT
jgi:hypothetical protein